MQRIGVQQDIQTLLRHTSLILNISVFVLISNVKEISVHYYTFISCFTVCNNSV